MVTIVFGSKMPSADSRSKQLVDGIKAMQQSNVCNSLLKQVFTEEMAESMAASKTEMGSGLIDVVQSGFANPDSGVGVYAPDAEAYTTFAPLFNGIISLYHGFDPATMEHPKSDFGDLSKLVNVDPEGKYVLSTRVRTGRNLSDYPFNPLMTEAHYKEMEERVTKCLSTAFTGELAGTYYPLKGMTPQVQQQLIEDHFLFKEGDRFLQAANACRYWPTGRGIWHTANKQGLIWVGEEDHLRLISLEPGADLHHVVSRLKSMADTLQTQMKFAVHPKLGFLAFCPTNLGTAVRASVHIKLPKLSADPKLLESEAAKFNLQVRGTDGEHSENKGGVYDISNKRRLGLTEFEAIMEMQNGILKLIQLEKELEKQQA